MLDLLLKPFIYFLWFKIFYTYSIGDSFSIIVSSLMSLSVSLIEFASMNFIGRAIGKIKVQLLSRRENYVDFHKDYFVVYFISLVFSIIISYLIIFGFDTKYFRLISFNFRYSYNYDNIIFFIIGIIIPTLIFNILLLWAIKRDLKAYERYVSGSDLSDAK